eukprot:CAMPEP_0174260618 /NCGR_PEP_ID=MMETSP0439-20130205/10098_1 /TAXON_ID=0 /ORGANISM="Stereomyxa ramosa, Strain Chinc5" /LENGTH=299 /DNA_ID=CAMNT_0015344897 /DNA_START=78 /DNA_END=977 /DNA_ORIENTATION=+
MRPVEIGVLFSSLVLLCFAQQARKFTSESFSQRKLLSEYEDDDDFRVEDKRLNILERYRQEERENDEPEGNRLDRLKARYNKRVEYEETLNEQNHEKEETRFSDIISKHSRDRRVLTDLQSEVVSDYEDTLANDESEEEEESDERNDLDEWLKFWHVLLRTKREFSNQVFEFNSGIIDCVGGALGETLEDVFDDIAWNPTSEGYGSEDVERLLECFRSSNLNLRLQLMLTRLISDSQQTLQLWPELDKIETEERAGEENNFFDSVEDAKEPESFVDQTDPQIQDQELQDEVLSNLLMAE